MIRAAAIAASKLRPHFSGLLAGAIARLLKANGAHPDQHQTNGSYGIHQLRVRLNDDPTVYRVIVCPADAPVWVGRDKPYPIDEHFSESING